LPKARRPSSAIRELRTIRTSLSAIVRALDRLAPLLRTFSHPAGRNPEGRRRPLKLSRERRAALKLQGQYMGYIRNLKPRQKARIKALKAAKGFRAAIGLAKRLGRQ